MSGRACEACGKVRVGRAGVTGRYRMTIVAVDFDENARARAGETTELDLCRPCLHDRIQDGRIKVERIGA